MRSPLGDIVASASYPGVVVMRRRLLPSGRAVNMSYSGETAHVYPCEKSGGGGHSPRRWCVDENSTIVSPGKKYPHVVRPRPVLIMWTDPEARSITNSWSHFRLSLVDWNISRFSSVEKYPSAFCPPNVSWRSVRKCTSFGTMSDVASSPGETPSTLNAQHRQGRRRLFMSLLFFVDYRKS